MAFLIQTLAGASVGASGGYSAAKSGESLSAKSSNCSAASIVDASNSESGVFEAAKKASVLLLVTSIIVVPLALPYVDVIHNYPLLFATTFIGAFMCMFVFVYICNHKTTGTLASKRNFFSIRSLNTEYSRRNLRNCFTRTLDIRGPYNVCLDNTSYHWILLFKPMDRRLNWLPILSIEITTDDEHKSIIPVMKKYKELPTPVCYKGSVEISMCELCAIGDRVLSKMESYELTTRNCQTFCNAILVELDLTEERTTVETVKSAAKIGGVVVTAAAVASMCTVM